MIRIVLALLVACVVAPVAAVAADPAVAGHPVSILVVSGPAVRIDAVRVDSVPGAITVRARLRWLVVPVTHRADHVRIAAFSNGQCVRAVVRSWNQRRHHQRLSSQGVHVTLGVGDQRIDQIRISRHADDPEAEACGA